MSRALCISTKATFGVCCASVESPLTKGHWKNFESSKKGKNLSLTTLKGMRQIGDLIEIYKVALGKENKGKWESINWVKLLKI